MGYDCCVRTEGKGAMNRFGGLVREGQFLRGLDPEVGLVIWNRSVR